MLSKRLMTVPKFAVNLFKIYFGLFMLNTPQGVLKVGILGSAIGITLLLVINIFTTYLVIKARNRYKMHDISTLGQLSLVCFGPKVKYFTDLIVISYGTSLVLSYNIYFGKQLKLLVCPVAGQYQDDCS
jgi:hypothetical protein